MSRVSLDRVRLGMRVRIGTTPACTWEGVITALGTPRDTLPRIWWMHIASGPGTTIVVQVAEGHEDEITIKEVTS
jgi:hypothetical protein